LLGLTESSKVPVSFRYGTPQDHIGTSHVLGMTDQVRQGGKSLCPVSSLEFVTNENQEDLTPNLRSQAADELVEILFPLRRSTVTMCHQHWIPSLMDFLDFLFPDIQGYGSISLPVQQLSDRPRLVGVR
jgi:hypothetical protein